MMAAAISVRLRRCLVAVFVTALGLVSAKSALAQPPCPSEGEKDCWKPAAYETARGLALATGLRATAISTSALAYSPAALALGNLYHLEGVVDYLPALKTVALGGNVVDSSTSTLGAGIGLRGFLSGDEGYDGLDGRLGLAFPFSDAFTVGLLGRYINLSQEIEDHASELAEGFTMDASIRITPVQGFQVDLGAQNFIDLETPYAPITLTAGIAIAAAQSLSFGADLLVDMTSFEEPGFRIGGAAEYLGGNSVPVRLGYDVDLKREIHAISGGIGYVDKQVSLDLSLRQEIDGDDDTRLMAAMKYHVH